MADQGQWFKLWVGADDDPDLGNLSNEDFGRWCKLGIYIKKHGSDGKIVIKHPAIPLQNRFQVSSHEEVVSILRKFPNCDVHESAFHGVHGDANSTVSPETILTVTWRNWMKYQGDFSTARVRKFREMKRSKRRGEERREEEKRIKDPQPALFDPSNPDPEHQKQLQNLLALKARFEDRFKQKADRWFHFQIKNLGRGKPPMPVAVLLFERILNSKAEDPYAYSAGQDYLKIVWEKWQAEQGAREHDRLKMAPVSQVVKKLMG